MRETARTAGAPALCTRGVSSQSAGLLGRVSLRAGIAIAACATLAGCHPSREATVRTVDLLELNAAELRPIGTKIQVEEHAFAGHGHPSLVTPPESRIIWQLPLQRKASLNTLLRAR